MQSVIGLMQLLMRNKQYSKYKHNCHISQQSVRYYMGFADEKQLTYKIKPFFDFRQSHIIQFYNKVLQDSYRYLIWGIYNVIRQLQRNSLRDPFKTQQIFILGLIQEFNSLIQSINTFQTYSKINQLLSNLRPEKLIMNDSNNYLQQTWRSMWKVTYIHQAFKKQLAFFGNLANQAFVRNQDGDSASSFVAQQTKRYFKRDFYVYILKGKLIGCAIGSHTVLIKNEQKDLQMIIIQAN